MIFSGSGLECFNIMNNDFYHIQNDRMIIGHFCNGLFKNCKRALNIAFLEQADAFIVDVDQFFFYLLNQRFSMIIRR